MERFVVHVPDAVLDDLRVRLERTRLPDDPVTSPWEDGTDPAFLRALLAYWRDGFDWRAHEAELNRWDHFRVDGLHFVHERADAPARAREAARVDGPARVNAPARVPLLVLHGWPSTFAQMTRILPMLTGDGFDVVVPSLPGFGFSDGRPGMNVAAMGELFHELMTGVLGYERYAVRGTDYGLSIALEMGAAHPGQVAGVHVGGTHLEVRDVPGDLTPDERAFVADSQAWYAEEGGYVAIQATKPRTLGYGLNDSPAGLAAWIAEKYRTWSARPDDLLSVFSMDDLLTTVTLYWATQTITSSMRLYREDRLRPPSGRRLAVPLAVSQPALEEFGTPREWWERLHPVRRWTLLPGAAHFPEWEAPRALADDIREFLAPLAR